MATEQKKASGVKPKSYLMVDGEPCRVASVSSSRPGKHGHAKHRIVAIGIFDGAKRELLATHDIETPIIEKRAGQVLAKIPKGTDADGNAIVDVQIMDLTTYETFELPLPSDIDVSEGQEVEYIDFEGRKKVTIAKSSD